MITPLVAIRVTRNHETGVVGNITDQKLVGVSLTCPDALPQSVGYSILPIVARGRYGLLGNSLKVNLFTSLVINEDNFSKLENDTSKTITIIKIDFEKHFQRKITKKRYMTFRRSHVIIIKC